MAWDAMQTFDLERVLARVRPILEDDEVAGPAVVELRGAAAASARSAAALAEALGRPLLRLAPEELLAEPYARSRALVRLLGEAAGTGGVVLVDGAEGFTADDQWLADRLRGVIEETSGIVVVLATTHAPHTPIAGAVLLIEDVPG